MNKISVIILYHNQLSMLSRVFFALGWQMAILDGAEVEIIVVDNGSVQPLSIDAIEPKFLVALCLDEVRIVRAEPAAMGFCVAHARNLGIGAASGEVAIFLDADSIPCPTLLQEYYAVIRQRGKAILIGHRYFVHYDQISDALLLSDINYLYRIPHIQSASNFGLVVDRRMPELHSLGEHPMPFNCLHGCNFAAPIDLLRAVGGFDTEFDGAWGFEDIELGHRLYRLGLPFVYVPMAHVFHQDDCRSAGVDRRDTRNLRLAESKIPGFSTFRRTLKTSSLFSAR
jgi:GT2 family glycosyltransferase